MSRPAERVVAFYNKRGTCEQWIKESKGAIKWTRLSCRTFAANAVRLQLHALAYNLGNFLRTLATPEPMRDQAVKHRSDGRECREPSTLSHLGFQPVQKTPTIHVSSGFIWGIRVNFGYAARLDVLPRGGLN